MKKNNLSFRKICDGANDAFHSDNQFFRTDKTECEEWPSDNLYTRCDDFENYPRGADERNCSQLLDRTIARTCLSPLNCTIIHLPNHRFSDGITDCLGGFDELRICRIKYGLQNMYGYRFRCITTRTMCITSSYLCDGARTCPSGDDENFCSAKERVCEEDTLINRTEVENILCKLTTVDVKKKKIRHFSLYNWNVSSLRPKNRFAQPAHHRSAAMKSVNAQSVSPTWAWSCNRVFSAYIRTDNMSYNQECFCLPAYFGHVCQYQNQRVSLTLGLLAVDLRNIYEIVAMLLEEDDHHHLKINSHSQLTFLPHLRCNIKFNIYLLYSTRPENMSKKYSVRIDAFNRNTVTYYASWYLSIPFPFLPVNRLTARLIIPSHLTHIPVNCPLTCYIDKDQFF